MVDRLAATAEEPQAGRWRDLANLLSDLYIQMQHQKQVTVYREGGKSGAMSDAARKRSQSMRPSLRPGVMNGPRRG
jgi:hypothetical protein